MAEKEYQVKELNREQFIAINAHLYAVTHALPVVLDQRIADALDLYMLGVTDEEGAEIQAAIIEEVRGIVLTHSDIVEAYMEGALK